MPTSPKYRPEWVKAVRRTFLTGLLVSLPLAITAVVFVFIFRSLDNLLGPLVMEILVLVGIPGAAGYTLPGVGVITTLALVFGVGVFTTNYLGRKLWDLGERIVTQIPIIRTVYIGAKQVIDTFSTSNTQAFSKVVMLEYPRHGIYCLAFITGGTEGEVQANVGRNLVNIFVPTTPNPTSGFLLMIPKDDVIELEMSIEEGIKMIVSGGIVTPDYIPVDAKNVDGDDK